MRWPGWRVTRPPSLHGDGDADKVSGTVQHVCTKYVRIQRMRVRLDS